MPSTTRVAGVCDPAFKAVREALEQNLAEGKEIGECVAVVVNGKTVVDLWGGYKDRARTQPWERDTLVCMFSVGKPLSILPVLILADRGRIELERPVCRYWLHDNNAKSPFQLFGPPQQALIPGEEDIPPRQGVALNMVSIALVWNRLLSPSRYPRLPSRPALVLLAPVLSAARPRWWAACPAPALRVSPSRWT